MADTESPRAGDSSMAALIANSGKVNVNWDAFAQIPENYRKGKDWAYQQELRNAFKDENGGFRQDLLDDKGNPDSGKMYQRLMTLGGAPVADAASKLAETGFQQERYRNAPTVEGALRGDFGPQSSPQQPAQNLPPSSSRGASTRVAPPLPRGGVAQGAAPQDSPQGDQPGSLIGFLSANNVPEQDQGSAANILGGQLSQALGRRVDPNAPLDMQNPQVRQVLGGFVRSRSGQQGAPGGSVAPAAPPAAPTAMQPQAQRSGASAASPPPSAAQIDPTLGGLVPPGYEPGAYVQRLEAIAGSGRVLPDQLKVLQGRIEGIRKALEPTPDMKNARAAGMPMKEFLDRADTANTDRAILTNSILPKLDKSQDAAVASRDEILAIHRSREQLDAPGGIFSGTAADTRLKLAKVAEFLGIPNADKIANTESFGSAIGQRTLSLVKGLGAGAGISNADRDFAAAMAGGNIKLDEKSIRRILDIGEHAARSKIDLHNGLTDRTLKSSESLSGLGEVYRVQPPGQYQRIQQAAPAPQAGAVMNGFKFLGGNPNDKRSWGRI